MRRAVLIQGATGGVGRALVEQLLATEEDLHLIVTSRQALPDQVTPTLTSYSSESSRKKSSRVDRVTLDLSSDESIARAAAQVAQLTPRLHLVITTAGVLRVDPALGASPEKKLTDLSRAVMHEVFSVNSFGPFLWYAALRPLFRHRDPLTIATLSARVGSISDNRLGGWYTYRASKAAQNMMTKTLSLELQRSNPRAIVVGLHPGTVDTSLSRPFQSRVPPEKLFTPERSASALLAVIAQLTPDQSGRVFAWDSQEIKS